MNKKQHKWPTLDKIDLKWSKLGNLTKNDLNGQNGPNYENN